jgi:hypothetical protein
MTSVTTSLTVKAYAGFLVVKPHQILKFIAWSELRATDISPMPGSGKASWRLTPSAIAEFESKRQAKPKVKPIRQRRQNADSEVTKYY